MPFEKLVEPLRREILAHCYRILGSFEDAEDISQEVLVRAGSISFRSKDVPPCGPGSTKWQPMPAWMHSTAAAYVGFPKSCTRAATQRWSGN
jgi:hypothetical protein